MIDGQVETPWPPDVSEALARFVQGSVIRRPPMMFWADPNRTLHRAGLRSDDDDAPLPDDGEEVVIADEDRPEYGVITTQTCDIQDAERPKKPFVHIAPVVLADPSWPNRA